MLDQLWKKNYAIFKQTIEKDRGKEEKLLKAS